MGAASLTAESPPTATTAETISARRAKAARAKARRLAKPFPALAAAVEAWAVLNAEEVRLGDLHTRAEEFGPEAELEPSFNRWDRARGRADRAAERIMRMKPTSPEMARAKAKIYQATQWPLGNPKADPQLQAPEHHFMVACLLEDLATLKTPAPPAGPFSEALAAYLARRQEEGRLAAILDANYEAGRGGPSPDNDAWEAANDRTNRALERVMATPSPDLAALAEKISLFHFDADSHIAGGGLANPLYVAELLAQGWEGRIPLLIAKDALRLVGREHEVAEEFDPRDWVQRYESAGGYVTTGHDGDDLIIDHPEGSALAPRCQEIGTELDEGWKCEAVKDYARCRSCTGGDPFYFSSGQRRAERPDRISPDAWAHYRGNWEIVIGREAVRAHFASMVTGDGAQHGAAS